MYVMKNSLYASLPLPSIPTELPPSPCAEKVYAFSDIVIYTNTIPGFQITATVLQHQRLHHTFTFSAHGESTGAAGDRGKLE